MGIEDFINNNQPVGKELTFADLDKALDKIYNDGALPPRSGKSEAVRYIGIDYASKHDDMTVAIVSSIDGVSYVEKVETVKQGVEFDRFLQMYQAGIIDRDTMMDAVGFNLTDIMEDIETSPYSERSSKEKAKLWTPAESESKKLKSFSFPQYTCLLCGTQLTHTQGIVDRAFIITHGNRSEPNGFGIRVPADEYQLLVPFEVCEDWNAMCELMFGWMEDYHRLLDVKLLELGHD